MGEKKLGFDIVLMSELIAEKVFDSESEIYAISDADLPRFRVGGKIKRPLRFYRKDVEKYLSKQGSVSQVQFTNEGIRPSITFKKRRK